MPRLSDVIESFLKEMLEEANEQVLEIQRNELANTFNCAPSQINYVLTTRFTVDRGYYIESRRGGGGCIKIKKINIDKNDYIRTAIWNNIGEEITQQEAEEYIEIFRERDVITVREAMIMRAAVNDKTLPLSGEIRNSLRAHILKTLLITAIN